MRNAVRGTPDHEFEHFINMAGEHIVHASREAARDEYD